MGGGGTYAYIMSLSDEKKKKKKNARHSLYLLIVLNMRGTQSANAPLFSFCLLHSIRYRI